MTKFDIAPLSRFNRLSATVRRPKEVTCFSYDDQHQYHPDERSLCYYYPPCLGADLSKGFDSFQKLDDTVDVHLDGLLCSIMDLEQRTGTKCEADIITWRGMMTKVNLTRGSTNSAYIEKIMTAPFDNSGYKFEAISVLPDQWGPTPREYIENREEMVVSNHAQYCSVVKTGIGKTKMIIGGEVDAIWDCKPQKKDAPINWVELKTTQEIENQRDQFKFERKLLKFWAQSFLLGVPKIIVGFRNEHGILQRLEELETTQIPAKVKRGESVWNGNVCINFTASFLDYLKAIITGEGVWKITRREKSPFIEVVRWKEFGHDDIVSEEFIQWRTSSLKSDIQPS
ncbi:decapping endonuclease targeting mRNA [Pseudocyphellaria aurata]|nr:decapping endonuclease targeting mRNA [Pseudocyphellaria aurata]